MTNGSLPQLISDIIRIATALAIDECTKLARHAQLARRQVRCTVAGQHLELLGKGTAIQIVVVVIIIIMIINIKYIK